MASVEDLLSDEERENFRLILNLARDFRTRVGLEMPDEEAGLSFAENRKIYKISNLKLLIYNFFRLRRERWSNLPLLRLPSLAAAAPAVSALTALAGPAGLGGAAGHAVGLSEDRGLSFETESRLWFSSRTSENSADSEKNKRRQIHRLIGKMSENFVEGETPLTASELLHALGIFREKFPTLTEQDVIDYVNEDPQIFLKKDFQKYFGFATNDPIVLFNFYCQHKISVRGFSHDQMLQRLIEQEISEEVSEEEISDHKMRRSVVEGVERLSKPRENISDLEIEKKIRQCLRGDKGKTVTQVYTEIFSGLEGQRKKVFSNFFSGENFQSEKKKFPIKKYPCVIRAVELEIGENFSPGDAVELRGGSEIFWRSEISCPGVMRVEQLVFVARGPVNVIGNFSAVNFVEIVTSEIYSKNFEVLVEEERRRLTMTSSASLRLSEISENFRLHSKLAKLRTMVKTQKFHDARKFLVNFDERNLLLPEISDLKKQVDQHFFLTQKVERRNFRSTLPPRTPDFVTKVVFGRTMRQTAHSSEEIPRRAKSEDQPRLESPQPAVPESHATPPQESRSSEISSGRFPIKRRVCLEWLKAGSCGAGDACRFSHGNAVGEQSEVSSTKEVVDSVIQQVLNSIYS